MMTTKSGAAAAAGSAAVKNIISSAALLLVVMTVAVSGSLYRPRKLTRFSLNHPDNEICWDRDGDDGFFTVVDSHNHFRPFGGPAVDFDEYLQWMEEHGILFSTMFGIGQLIKKQNPTSPDCCYYMHCPTFQYKVEPDPTNDFLNAKDFLRYRDDENLTSTIHLLPSLTFPNLQNPENNMKTLKELLENYPAVFGWAGEINVFKHALAGNGFFHFGNRVTVARVDKGILDDFFMIMERERMPVTLHCDLGCDNYDALKFTPPLPIKMCETPPEELVAAAREHLWWKDMLSVHYEAFFDENNKPIPKQFRKIMHLRVWDTILQRYPDVNIVWAHVGLSKELKDIHPLVHMHIVTTLFKRHTNLYTDVSWDVIPKRFIMNYKNDSIARLMHTSHADFHDKAKHLFNKTAVYELRDKLHNTIWEQHKGKVYNTGSALGGPTYTMAIYLETIEAWSDRFLTGTDFVASAGPKEDYPGLPPYKSTPTGCMKDQANHARQLTDTSTMNMFLSDEAFTKIVLGENYFKLTGLNSKFGPPPICGTDVGLSSLAIGLIIAGVLLALIIIIIVVILFIRYQEE